MFDYLRDADQLSTTNLKGEISNMTLDVNAYAEVGLGYSRAINDRLTVGGRVKFCWDWQMLSSMWISSL